MGLQDRDYMREKRSTSVASQARRWWREHSLREILGVGILAVTLISSLLWLVRGLDFSFGTREASLCVNVNTATQDELETLPGIGPSLAAGIIAGRPFDQIADLERVKGIGPATVQSLRHYAKTTGQTEKAPCD